MEIDTLTLLAYATIWTVFYFFLSNYIAELSRKKWTTWVQSEESDDILVEALQAVILEIEDRMHDKLDQVGSDRPARSHPNEGDVRPHCAAAGAPLRSDSHFRDQILFPLVQNTADYGLPSVCFLLGAAFSSWGFCSSRQKIFSGGNGCSGFVPFSFAAPVGTVVF